MNSSQIATLINEIYDGVERSKVGKIQLDELNKEGQIQYSGLGFNAFLKILDSFLPKDVGLRMREELK